MSDNLVKKDRIPDRLVNYLHQNWKILIYSACGLGLSWIDLWRGIGNGAQWALAVNCTGFCIFPMIVLRLDWRMLLPGYRVTVPWEKIFRIVFCVWSALFLAGAYPVFRYFAPRTDYDAQIATAVLNIGLYGAVAIRMYFYLFFEKKHPSEAKTEQLNRPMFILWLVFMVSAIISVNRFIWPLWFLVMFGSLYLAPLRKGEMEEIIVGISNGIIIGFFWIQSRAFLYRPYDVDHRYYGHYTNPNVNAMFYLYTYIAWLVRLTAFRIRNSRKMYAFTFLMASSMWVFEFFTGCRTAWLAFAFVTFMYWYAESCACDKRLRIFFTRIILMGLIAMLTFVPVFACMRYIPALRHHPIWYQAEYSDDRVMSWDPIDSPKYQTLKSAVYGNLGRLAFFADNTEAGGEDETDAVPESEGLHEHDVIYADDGETILSYSDGVVPGTDSLHPMYTHVDYERNLITRALGIRFHIYRYIIERIKPFGNREPYFTVWLIDGLPLGHAHNNILMMMYWFGPVSGLAFVAIMAVAFGIGLKTVGNGGENLQDIVLPEFTLMVMVGFFLSGLTECTVFPGEYGLTMFFLALLPVICRKISADSQIKEK